MGTSRVRLAAGTLALVAFVLVESRADAQVRVRGYTRKDGTYVAPHYRSSPDGRVDNNWSTRGNVNPYTGQEGSRSNTHVPATRDLVTDSLPPGSTSDPDHLLRPTVSPYVETSASPHPNSPGTSSAIPTSDQLGGKTATLSPPNQLSSRKGWQITWSAPLSSPEEEIRLTGAYAVACGSDYHSPCRPVTRQAPAVRGETSIDRAVFFGALNRVSEKLEVWGFPTIQACEQSRKFVESILSQDYVAPSACVVVKLGKDNAAATPQPSGPTRSPGPGAAQPSEQEAVLRALVKHACYTGCAMAQVKLPKVPQEDELLGRGFLSCDGRLVNRPETLEEDHLIAGSCAYAVGAMFARYGLGREIVADDGTPRFSPRAAEAVRLCLKELTRQNIPGAKSELAAYDRELSAAITGRAPP
jgi:hypothetical protein